MHPESLAVIGLGAIGGSVAWRAARAGVSTILGYSVPPVDALSAARAGAVTEVMTSAEKAVDRAELVVLAVPPRAILDLLGALAPRIRARGVIATDVASVKAPIVRRAGELGLHECFAGSHPFAGTHESGFKAARPDLLEARVVYVTPAGERAAAEVADFWERVIGADVVKMDPGRHDALMAWSSHLPQAVASALAVTLAEHLPRGATLGSGALSTTRLAASSVEMWADILLLNRDPVMEALASFGQSTDRLRDALAAGDEAAVIGWLTSGRTWRSHAGD